MLVTLYYVVPCYEDDAVLPITGPCFLKKLKTLIDEHAVHENSRVLFVNDGSSDCTWDVICALHAGDPHAVGISLAENVGEKTAILAGMDYAVACGADCVITADSDLQDDLDVTEKMLEKYILGNEIVLGVRSQRDGDPISERFFSKCFYVFMRLLKTGLVPEHSNFRLMSAKAVCALKEHEKEPYFMPAMVSVLPFQRAVVLYKRVARTAGSSRYNFRKKTRLAVEAMLVHSVLLKRFLPGIFLFLLLVCFFCILALVYSWFHSAEIPMLLCLAGILCFCGACGAGILHFFRKRIFRLPPASYVIASVTEDGLLN